MPVLGIFFSLRIGERSLFSWVGRWQRRPICSPGSGGGKAAYLKEQSLLQNQGRGVADSTQARSLGPAPSASLFRSGELKAVQAVFLLFPTTTDKCKYPYLVPIIPGKGAVTQLEGWTQKKTK